MNWLVANQHRGQALWALTLLTAMSAVIVGVGLHASHGLAPYNHWLTELQAAGCPLPGQKHNGPTPAICNTLSQQLQNFQSNVFAPSYSFAIPVFEYGVPLALIMMSILAGAPLVAREIEQRTQLVAWTQSVSRRKWYTVKVLTLGAGLAVISLIAGFANGWLQHPLTEGGLTSSRWPWFFAIDLALTGDVLLAYALAVALGAWLRRTLPAIGGALAGSLVLLLATGLAVRTLTPTSHTTAPHFTVPLDGWIIQSPNGHSIPYHPASQYWPLQLTFLTIALTLAAALLASGWHATRTRAI
jgi:hypothetical protein